MVSTRAFLWTISRTVIPRPRLYSPAIKLLVSSRARNRKGIMRYFPSGRYLAFRVETQYGVEHVDRRQLAKEVAHYLEWCKSY